MKKIFFLLFIIIALSCKKETNPDLYDTKEKKKTIDFENKSKEKFYYQFKPDSVSNIKIKNVSVDYSYEINNNKVVTGNFEPTDGKINYPDSENDWGDRLFFLNEKNKVIFKGKGVGDVYLYEPYFFKNDGNDKIIIVCQLGYEYFFGGDAFILENRKIKHIGKIDIENTNMETKLIDILNIKELDSKIIFTFKSDSLILKPGSEDIIVKNNDIKYEYFNKSLKLIK